MSEEFEDLVAKDVRGVCSDAELDILESDTRLWLNTLNSLRRDVEVQLVAQRARMTQYKSELLETYPEGDPVARREWIKFKGQEETWKVSAVRFMVEVEKKVQYVKALRESQVVGV
jgi:hypothetical protein